MLKIFAFGHDFYRKRNEYIMGVSGRIILRMRISKSRCTVRKYQSVTSTARDEEIDIFEKRITFSSIVNLIIKWCVHMRAKL